jgi:hypothetical protein
VGGSHRCVKFVVRPFARRIRAAVSLRASTGVTQLARKRLRPGQLRATRASDCARAVCAQHAQVEFCAQASGCEQFARNTHIEILRVKKPVVRRLCAQDVRRQIARNDVYPWVARSCSRSSGCAQPFPSSDCAQLLRPQIARNRSRSSDCAQNPHAQSARSRRQRMRWVHVVVASRLHAELQRESAADAPSAERPWTGEPLDSPPRISQPVRSVDNP